LGFKHLRSLRISPLGCVPQRDRRPPPSHRGFLFLRRQR
jgi:hypothetical protein